MHRLTRGRRLTLLVLAIAVIGVLFGYTAVSRGGSSTGAPTTTAPGGPSDGGTAASSNSLAAQAATTTLALNPTAQLSAQQIGFLRQVAQRTWGFLSGPDLDPVTRLSRNNVAVASVPTSAAAAAVAKTAPPGVNQDFTSPTEIGLYLSSIAAARDLNLVDATQASLDASAVLKELQRLPKYDGFLLRWYDTTGGGTIATPSGGTVTAPFVSTVDNAWLAQGLLVDEQAFPELSAGFGALLGAMQWKLLYDPAKNVLYNGYTVGKGASTATYNLAYSGPRIAEYMAMGSGQVPGSLWWGLNRTPPANQGQRQTPGGSEVTYDDPQSAKAYQVFEGYYVYDGIKFVPTFAGSMYQALAPDMIFPEQVMAPLSLGLNDRNTSLAQDAYATDNHDPVWGWAPATTPEKVNGYAQYGAPGLATKKGTIPDSAITPYAAALALASTPETAYDDLANLVKDYPNIYTSMGFLDSVDPQSHQVAGRYMAVSQEVILLAIDNAVDHDELQTYAGNSAYGKAIAPYLTTEHYMIQGLGSATATPSSAGTTAATPTATSRPHRRTPVKRVGRRRQTPLGAASSDHSTPRLN